jgi:hypothetical protein
MMDSSLDATTPDGNPRTRMAKDAGSKKPARAMAYKLLDADQEPWRSIKRPRVRR